MKSKSWCSPGQLLMLLQVLRNLTDEVDGFLLGKTHLIMDAPERTLFVCRAAVPT
jgi:hypothetical protein